MTTDPIIIRFEDIAREGDAQVVAAEVSGVTDRPYRLWYRVPGGIPVDEVGASHAFAVSVIQQAMAVGRDLEIRGPVTPGLVGNLKDYQRVWSTWAPRRFRCIEVRGTSRVDDEPYRPARGTVLPFSGGLDSLYSAMSLAADGELGALVTIHGLDVALGDAPRWAGVLEGVRACARSLARPLHEAATNWHEIAPRLPGYLGYFLPTVAVPALLAGRYGGTATPSWWSYDNLELPTETTPLTDSLLGRPGFPVRHHGAWARRIDKAAALSTWPEALRHMRPCDATSPDGTACRRCRKCVQTALLFLGLGLAVPSALGSVVPSLEDIEGLEVTAYSVTALGEAIAAARSRGANDAWIGAAERRIARFGGDPAAVGEVDRLERRLRYVLGGRTRTRLGGALRRVSRALRGVTGPRDLPPLPRRPYRAARDGSTAGPIGGPAFATSPRGRRIYVDESDWRGASLVAHGGDLGPVAARMWRALLGAGGWTHVVDVGANYGELLIDLDPTPGVRRIAVEPNPHVRRHLERSLREAGLPVELVAKALSDQLGRIGMTIDRTWSGLSGVVLDPSHSVGHRVEELEVETTTLRALLAGGSPDREKRVLVKIDVEGHEPAVLRGLGGAATGYGAFAALVEIRHATDVDLAEVLESFTVELFDERAGAFVAVVGRSPAAVRARLEAAGIHRDDAVLRPRAGA